jgi:hypothetical protein
MTNTQRHACREAVKLLRDRCKETDALQHDDVKYGLRKLLESETVTAALSPGRLGQLEDLKRKLDISEATAHDPQTIKDLQGALGAFLDEELSNEQEEGNHMARRDEEESYDEEAGQQCSACGHLNSPDDEEEDLEEAGVYAPENLASDGIRRGNALAQKTARTAKTWSNDEFTVAEGADEEMGAEQSDEQCAKEEARADGYARYHPEAEALRSPGLSALAKRKQCAEQDQPPHAKYLLSEKDKRKHESMRESMRQFNHTLHRMRERVVVVPRGADAATRMVASLQW